MYPLGRPAAEIAHAAEAIDGPFATALAQAASALGVTAIAGMFEKVPGERRVHNTVIAVSAQGLLGRYRKLHLYDALGEKESDSIVPGPIDGDELLVLPIGEFVVGVVTCYDLRFPELFRVLADRGVTVFAVPAAWVAGPLKQEHWVTMCRGTRDREHLLSTCSCATAAHVLRPQPRARPHGRRDCRSRRDRRCRGPRDLRRACQVRARGPAGAARRGATRSDRNRDGSGDRWRDFLTLTGPNLAEHLVHCPRGHLVALAAGTRRCRHGLTRRRERCRARREIHRQASNYDDLSHACSSHSVSPGPLRCRGARAATAAASSR